jgi:hypothetical protein
VGVFKLDNSHGGTRREPTLTPVTPLRPAAGKAAVPKARAKALATPAAKAPAPKLAMNATGSGAAGDWAEF